jgi:hypothetical protein
MGGVFVVFYFVEKYATKVTLGFNQKKLDLQLFFKY